MTITITMTCLFEHRSGGWVSIALVDLAGLLDDVVPRHVYKQIAHELPGESSGLAVDQEVIPDQTE